MGYYINQDSKGNDLGLSKLHALLKDGATQIEQPKEWQEGIICVIDNGLFDAACYCYNQSELDVCAEDDGREKTWLNHPQAKELAK